MKKREWSQSFGKFLCAFGLHSSLDSCSVPGHSISVPIFPSNDAYIKMRDQGFGRNSGLRMYVEPFWSECTAQTHCVLGLAEIPSLPHSLPDDRMRHIFSRDFRKDFTPRYCNIRTTPRHNVILNNEIVLICHRIPVWIFPKIFHCIFDTLFEEIGDIISSFLEFSVQKSVIFSTASSRATFFLWKSILSGFWPVFPFFANFVSSGAFWPLLSSFGCILGAAKRLQ